MNVIAKTATNSQFGWYRPHMLWTKHMPQKQHKTPHSPDLGASGDQRT